MERIPSSRRPRFYLALCLPPPLLAIGRDGEFQFGADKPETRIVGLWRLPLWPGWLYN